MQAVDLNQRVEKIKYIPEDIELLVEEYKPFIASCTQKLAGRYVKYGEDDELSIALLAFVEAINCYERKKGNFLTFSENVIKRRLIDYFRKEKRHTKVVPLTAYYADSEEEMELDTRQALEKYSVGQESEARRLELEELKDELFIWGISFEDLIDESPKHDKTRKMCSQILGFLLEKPDLINTIKHKKTLTIAEIEKGLKVPRKKVERMRKYILATVIIATGDYRYVREYINLPDYI